MMKYVTGLVLLVATSVVAVNARGQAQTTATVLGRVMDREAGTPVADAVVSARAGNVALPEVRTDGEGKFVLRNVPAGSVTFGAVKAGYQGSSTARRRVEIAIKPGDRVTNVVVMLSRFAVIGGTVRDERSEPAVGLTVRLLRSDGRSRWAGSANAQTDDRGMYRFSGLLPGDYRVWVPSSPARKPGSEDYPATFAPAVRRPDGARTVSVESGAVAEGIDVALSAVRAGRLSGRLVGPSVSGIPVQLVLAHAGYLTGDIVVASATSGAAGQFTFPRVAAGDYEIRVLQAPRAQPAPARTEINTGSERLTVPNSPAAAAAAVPAGPTLWVSMPVSLTGEDLSNVDVPIRTGRRVSGRVTFVGSAAPPQNLANVAVMMQPVDGRPTAFLPGRIGRDLTFTTPELPSGSYVVSVAPIESWTLERAELGGRDVSDLAFELGNDPIEDVVLTFTDRAPVVSGVVRGADGLVASDALVVAFPTDRALWSVGWSPRRMKSAHTDSNGAFSLGVPAGAYYVAALDESLADGWNEIDSLATLAGSARRVDLDSGGKTTLNLSLMRRSPAADDEPFVSGPYVPDEPQAVAAQTGRMRVRVVADQSDEQPLAGVLVTLLAPGGKPVATEFTDGEGRADFAGIDVPSVKVMAAKPAYLSTEFGAKRPGRPGTSVVLKRDGITDVAIRLTRGSVIAGRVTDYRGAPMSGMTVKILSRRGQAGDSSLEVAPEAAPTNATTDDRGQYRVYGLPAGEYFVGVTPGSSGAERAAHTTTVTDLASARGETPASDSPAGETTFSATFYPASIGLDGAAPVSVGAAEERNGIDISVKLTPVASLSGQVFNPTGQAASGARIAIFPNRLYIPGDTTLAGGGVAISQGGAVNVTATPTGTFTVRGLPPGPYTLYVRGADAGPRGEALWALDTVTVAGRDSATSVSLRPALTLRGKVAGWPGTASQGSIGLTSVNSGALSVAVPPAPIGPDGAFSISGVLPGRYWIALRGVPTGMSVKSGTAGGEDVLDRPLELTGDREPPELSMELSAERSGLDGRLALSSGAPATDFYVIVFSSDREHWIRGSRRIRATRPGSDGQFSFDDMPPGEYRLAAMTDVEDGEWFDPTLLDALMSSSVNIRVVAGRRSVQDLEIAIR